jgi:hypothetical protein
MSADALVGRYELGERIGSGGMASVVRATDTRLERTVAVKLLAEHLADDTQFVQRFQREAKSAARLVHPNIVQVFDYGFDPQSGRYYIVMEYVEGRSCAQLLAEHGRLSLDHTLHLADGACRALDHAHRHGVIHRDVKPGNILLSSDGQVKLADFGIAWAGDAMSVTQHGAVLGTIAYLAPEQAEGQRATPQGDVYGLGVVIFQLLTGRLPFQGQSLTDLVLAQRDRRPPELDRLVQGVPRHVGAAVSRALALDPADRPASAGELRALLLGADPTAATQLGAATAATQLGGQETGVTRVSRRDALTGRVAGGAVAGGTGVQRLQPREGAPRAAAPGQQAARGAAQQPQKAKGSSGGKVATAAVVGILCAGAGGLFGMWLSDQMSGINPLSGGGDASSLVQDLAP